MKQAKDSVTKNCRTNDSYDYQMIKNKTTLFYSCFSHTTFRKLENTRNKPIFTYNTFTGP